MRAFISCVFCALASFAASGHALANTNAQYGDWHLSVAILEDSGVHFQKEARRSFIETLKQTAEKSQISLDIRVLKAAQIQSGVKDGQIDIFFSDSLTYRSLVSYGVKDIAGVQSQWTPNPNHADGGVAFALRRDNTEPVLESYQKKSAVSSETLRTQALYYVLGAIKEKGHDPESFFSTIDLTVGNPDEIVRAVLNDRSEVGIVPACFLEEHFASNPQDISRIEILDAYRSPEFPCTVSTTLFPGWVVALTSRVPLSFARELTAALLQTPPSKGFWWTIPTQYDIADDLLKTLKVENFAYLREWTLTEFISRYGVLIGVFLAAFLATIFYGWAAGKIARRLNRQLMRALTQKERFQSKLAQAESQLSFLERVGMLTQVSAVLAHELRQPVGSIVMFAHGLMRRLENDLADKKEIMAVTEKIARSASLSNEIITRVRDFAKSGSKRRILDLTSVAVQAKSNFLIAQRSVVAISIVSKEKTFIKADAFELELMLVNLFRNSADAMAGSPNPQICVSIAAIGPDAVVTVKDTGVAGTLPFKKLFQSTKDSGMGMGLKLVREIAQNNGGTVSFSKTSSGSLVVEIRFPSVTAQE